MIRSPQVFHSQVSTMSMLFTTMMCQGTKQYIILYKLTSSDMLQLLISNL